MVGGHPSCVLALLGAYFFCFVSCGLFDGIWNLLPNPLQGLFPSGRTDAEYPTGVNVSTVRYVSIVGRHGSRSPIYTFKKDIYPYTDRKYWPDGPGQLTRFGKRQMYALGQTYRMRYNGFLPIEYDPDDLEVFSNHYARDYMSGLCMLAGLYPPLSGSYQEWNPLLPWQPIPIWEEPFDVIRMLKDLSLCPAFGREQEEAVRRLNRKFSDRYRTLLDFLQGHAGQTVDRITDVEHIWDVLTQQFENGYKLPEWSKSVYPKKLAPLYSATFSTLVAGSPLMARLTAGPVLRNISGQMMEKVGSGLKRKMSITLSHDVTLQALMSGLGLGQPPWRPLAEHAEPFIIDTSAAMVFELHETPGIGHHVQVYYFKNSGHRVPEELFLAACGRPCSLNRFNKLVDELAPGSWHQACQL